MARQRAQPIWDIVEEQLDEAAFLWTLRDRALASPRYRLGDVEAGPEERLRAHLDGVACGGLDTVDPLLRPALAGKDPARAAAAALALTLVPGADLAAAAAADAIATGPEPRRRAVARALALSGHPDASGILLAQAREGDPPAKTACLDALDLAGIPLPADLEPLLASPESAVRSAALRAARRWGTSAREHSEAALDAADLSVREAGIELGLGVRLQAAYAASLRMVEAGVPGCDLAFLVVGASGGDADVDALEAALRQPGLRKAALRGLGLSGRARAADLCVQHLRAAPVARVAAEALGAITGLVIEGDFLAPPPDEPEEPIPFEDEDLDANLVEGPEAELPAPDPEPVEHWWAQNKGRFDGRTRYVDGRPWTPAALVEAFASGSMRRRGALAVELRARADGFQVDARAWAREQRRSQELLLSRPSIDAGPFG